MPPIIQYASDLHLEFRQNSQYLLQNPLQVKGSILLLAGDIVCFNETKKHNYFFDFLSDHFEYTYWLPGNHEYYNNTMDGRTGKLTEYIRNNVLLVNNEVIEINDCRLLFTTLWTKVSPASEWDVERGMNDYRLIKKDGYRLSVPVTNQLHQENLHFLETELAKPFLGKTIVCTHHVPTLMHYPKQYLGSTLNEGFAVELLPFIENSGAAAWVYGHHHSNTPAFAIGSTQMLTNQLGYVHLGEHKSFDPAKTIEL